MNDEEFEAKLQEVKKHITPLKVAREATKLIAHHSVSAVAAGIVKKYCPAENKKQKLELTVGAYIIAGMFADRAVDWAAHEFDEKLEWTKKLVEAIKTSGEKAEEPTVTEEPTKEEEPSTE
jgi:hypothetical protein